MAHNIEAILQIKDNMSATLKVVESNVGKFGKTLQGQGRALRNFGTKIGYLGKDLMKLNAPFIAVGGWATKLGIDFEAVTSEAQAIMGVASEEMGAFEQKAREVGGATSASATESMEAIKLLGQSGMAQADILETVYPLVRLSEAGNIDMARSADLLTNSMKSAGIEMNDTTQYLDQIALAGNLSNTSIGEQMEAWLTAGGAIESANMQMSEANALLGVMANRGVKGSGAGNTLARVFQNLNATTGEAGKAMEKLDIQTANSDGSLRNKVEVLKELKEKTDAMNEADREHYLTMIGGKAHTENLKKMLAGLGDEYDELEGQLAGADGALEKMAITMKDNLKGKLEELSSAAEEFGLKLAESLVPMLENVVDNVKGFVDRLNELDKEQIDSIINVVLFTTKLALLLITVGSVMDTVGKFKRNIGDLIGMFAEGSAFSRMFGTSGLALAGKLAIIGLVIATVIKHWDKIGPAVKEAYEAIKEFITGSPEIMEAFEGIKEAVENTMEGIITFIQGALQVITGIFSADGEMIKEGMVNMFKGGWETIKNLWQGLLELLSVPIEAVVKLIEGPFPGAAEKLRSIWGALKTFLSNPAEGISKLKDMASSKIETLRTKWTNLKTTFAQAVRGRVNAITDKFHSAVGAARKAWESLKTFLSNPIKGTVNLAKRGAGWLKDKVVGSNWQGTSNWRGGPTFLHEKGPEIFDLPGGTRVYPHDKSIERAYADGQASSGGGTSVTIPKLADTIVVREEADIDRIAESLAIKLEQTGFNMA